MFAAAVAQLLALPLLPGHVSPPLLLLCCCCRAHMQVIAVGEGVTLGLAAGDKVVFNKYAMAEVEVPDGEIIFVAEKSILAKLE